MRHVWVIEQRHKTRWYPWCSYEYLDYAQRGLRQAREENPGEQKDFRLRKYVPASQENAPKPRASRKSASL